MDIELGQPSNSPKKTQNGKISAAFSTDLSRLVARQVSRAVQSTDPGLPLRDRAEPQTPALPTLLLAISDSPSSETPIRKSLIDKPHTSKLSPPNARTLWTFSTGPVHFRPILVQLAVQPMRWPNLTWP
jgi:hypothetical protein